MTDGNTTNHTSGNRYTMSSFAVNESNIISNNPGVSTVARRMEGIITKYIPALNPVRLPTIHACTSTKEDAAVHDSQSAHLF